MYNPFCFISLHNWEYRKEKHPCKNHPKGREYIRVIVRECKWCGHREHHSLPRVNGKFLDWKSFDDVKPNDCIDIQNSNNSTNDK